MVQIGYTIPEAEEKMKKTFDDYLAQGITFLEAGDYKGAEA